MGLIAFATQTWMQQRNGPPREDARKLPTLTSSYREMVINTTCHTKRVVLHSG